MTNLSITPEFRPLGKSGLSVFPIAYGMWRFAGTSPQEARAKIDAALEVGMTLFDTADIYGVDGDGAFGDAEKLFGEVLREAPSVRDNMVIASKGGIVLGVPYDSSAEYLAAACEASLTRMGIEQIDLYQIHRPDILGHPAEVAAALTKLRADGKIAHVGISNHTPAQFEALQAHLDFPIATNQPEVSCWALDPVFDGTLDQCMQHGVTPLAWSPLAGGRLALPKKEALSEEDGDCLVATQALLDKIAGDAGVSREAVALAWLLAHPAGIIPIIGTQNLKRIAAANDAFKVTLSRQNWYAILQASMGENLP